MGQILYKTDSGYVTVHNITASPTEIVDSLDSEDVTAALSANQGKVLNNSKADKATTLSGYGIADAYTKDEVDDMLGDIETILKEINGED